MKLLAIAIFLGLASIAAAILLTNRYELERPGDINQKAGQSVWRVDQFTGETRFCQYWSVTGPACATSTQHDD